MPTSRLVAGRARSPRRSRRLSKSVDIPYQQFTLTNGLRVIVHTDRKAPIVAVSVWYNVGSKFEPAGKTGFAHLFEHLMFNGSENAPERFLRAAEGSRRDRFQRHDLFRSHQLFRDGADAARSTRALFLESDRMGHLLGAITQAWLDRQRGVVQNEKRQDDNEPYGLVEYKQLEGAVPRRRIPMATPRSDRWPTSTPRASPT